MSTLIYQVYVGKKSKLYDHCTASVKAYAEQIGADYILQEQPILRIKPNPFTSNRSKEAVDRLGYLPIYEKENAFDYLDVYDSVAIIDSDVYVRPNTPSVFDAVDDDTDFAAVVERDMPITAAYENKIANYSRMQYQSMAAQIDFDENSRGFEFMNMGVIVVNKSFLKYMDGMTAKQWLEQAMFQDFIDGKGAWKWSTDQTLLNAWIRLKKMNIQRLHWKWNGLYSANRKINQCHFVHFFLKDKLPANGENVAELMEQI
jgi:hypothetical protein